MPGKKPRAARKNECDKNIMVLSLSEKIWNGILSGAVDTAVIHTHLYMPLPATVLVYVCSPVAAIVGKFTCEKIAEGPEPESIRSKTLVFAGCRTGHTTAELREMAQKRQLYAMTVADVAVCEPANISVTGKKAPSYMMYLETMPDIAFEPVRSVPGAASRQTVPVPVAAVSGGAGAGDFEKMKVELCRLFCLINDKYYGGAVEMPVITIQLGARGPKIMSWSSEREVWINAATKKRFYELSLNSSFMDRPVEDIVASMCHEMVHIYNSQQGIKDSSRAGTYHNQSFHDTAESHGLIASPTEITGYSDTSLSDELRAYILENVTPGVFVLTREADPEPEKKANKKKKSKEEKEEETPPEDGGICKGPKVNVGKISAGLDDTSMEEALPPSKLQDPYGKVGHSLPPGADRDHGGEREDDGGDWGTAGTVEQGEGPVRRAYRATCPVCGYTVLSDQNVFLVCGNCITEMKCVSQK